MDGDEYVRCTKCGTKITVSGKVLSEPEPEMPTRVAFYNAMPGVAAGTAGSPEPHHPEAAASAPASHREEAPASPGGWFVIQMSMQPITMQGANRDQRITLLEADAARVNQTRFTRRDGEQLQETLELEMELLEARLRSEMKDATK